MSIKNLLLTGAVTLLGVQAYAQGWVNDTVSLGAGYTNDVFYSLKNDEAKTSPNDNWHLAFQMTPQGPYGNVSIWANHTHDVRVYATHLKASSNFTTLTDSTGYTGDDKALYNSDVSWNYGAFNQMAGSSPFDYSWGKYDMTTHNVIGDSLYIVTIPNAVYKVWIELYDSTPADSVHWKFRIAKIDGSDDTTVKIYRKPDYTDRLFAYYDITTKAVSDREPSRAAWDMLFTHYMEYIMPGFIYGVTGILSNFDVTVAQKYPALENDTMGFVSYAYTDTLKQIGSDWKHIDMNQMPPAYVIQDSNYYFIKTKNTNEYYQLQFTGFGGSATGDVIFRKRLLGVYNPLSVADAQTPVNVYRMVPNPANNDVSILIDTKEAVGNARLLITDVTGRIIHNHVVPVTRGMNAFTVSTANIATGTYIVTVTNGSWKVAEKLVVQH